MVTGFILAGGKSSRMGREKALLPVGQQPLIEIVIRRLRPSVQRLIVVANAHNVCRLERLPVEALLIDLKPDSGPLMGIYTGLMNTQTPLNLFVPCDMPWVEGRLIDRLVSAYREGVEFIASLHPLEGVQPFPLVCHVKGCRSIGALLNQGERSLQMLFQQSCTQLVRVEEPDWWPSFTNVNTVADYAKLTDDPSTLPPHGDLAQDHGERAKRVEP